MGIFDDETDGPETTDDQILECESRLQEAGYYRSLMDANLFGDDADPIAERVTQRVRDFARREIAVIIGAKSTQAPPNESLKSLSQLTDEEVSNLKLLLLDLSEQEVIILRTMVGRIKDDPGAAGMFIRAGTIKKPGRPVVKQVAKPNGQRTLERVTKEKVKPEGKPDPKIPVKETFKDGGAKATSGSTRSVTAVPFPTGDAFYTATMGKSESAVRAAGQVAAGSKELQSSDLTDRND